MLIVLVCDLGLPAAAIEMVPESSVSTVEERTLEERERWWKMGMKAISEGKLAVLLLSGGQVLFKFYFLFICYIYVYKFYVSCNMYENYVNLVCGYAHSTEVRIPTSVARLFKVTQKMHLIGVAIFGISYLHFIV